MVLHQPNANFWDRHAQAKRTPPIAFAAWPIHPAARPPLGLYVPVVVRFCLQAGDHSLARSCPVFAGWPRPAFSFISSHTGNGLVRFSESVFHDTPRPCDDFEFFGDCWYPYGLKSARTWRYRFGRNQVIVNAMAHRHRRPHQQRRPGDRTGPCQIPTVQFNESLCCCL